jgi:hypothetical protein
MAIYCSCPLGGHFDNISASASWRRAEAAAPARDRDAIRQGSGGDVAAAGEQLKLS